MENSIKIRFKKEETNLSMNLQQPDLAELIHKIVFENLQVSKENIDIESTADNFDIEEFKDILITVHGEFNEEISKFFENIRTEIKTYYDNEALSEEIIKSIKETE